MDFLFWLDMPLMGLGLLAMMPGLWYLLRLRRIACRPALGRGVPAATALLFCLGLGALTTAGVDAGLAQLAYARREPGKEDTIHESMMAPDFILPSLDEDRTVHLSDFRGQKPVILIFGNFY